MAGTERGPTKLTYRLLSPRLGVRFDFIWLYLHVCSVVLFFCCPSISVSFEIDIPAPTGASTHRRWLPFRLGPTLRELIAQLIWLCLSRPGGFVVGWARQPFTGALVRGEKINTISEKYFIVLSIWFTRHSSGEHAHERAEDTPSCLLLIWLDLLWSWRWSPHPWSLLVTRIKLQLATQILLIVMLLWCLSVNL